MFVAGPPIVERLGETCSKQELGGWAVQLAAGAVDHAADTEDEAFACARRFLSYLLNSVWEPSARWGSLPLAGGIEAAYRAELDAAPDREAARAAIEARLERLRLFAPPRRSASRTSSTRATQGRCSARSPIWRSRCAASGRLVSRCGPDARIRKKQERKTIPPMFHRRAGSAAGRRPPAGDQDHGAPDRLQGRPCGVKPASHCASVISKRSICGTAPAMLSSASMRPNAAKA
jgi:hypothetical protein